MSDAQHFENLYRDISNSISNTLADIQDIEVDSEEGKEKLSEMSNHLKSIQEKFQDELEFLEEHAEWDQFTVAFFGETNSGKSTILESLRILFSEEDREKVLEQNKYDIDLFSESVRQHQEKVQTKISEAMIQHSSDVSKLRDDAARLLENIKEERAERLKILEDESSGRIKKKLVATALVSIVIGAGIGGPIGVVLGG